MFDMEALPSDPSGKKMSAKGRIPTEGEFFKDHFPAFPVLPGVLALAILTQTLERRYEELGSPYFFSLKKIRQVKFSSTLRPGDLWESCLERLQETEDRSEWYGRLFHQGRVAVSARLTFQRHPSFKKARQIQEVLS